jgi:hypothetical protein
LVFGFLQTCWRFYRLGCNGSLALKLAKTFEPSLAGFLSPLGRGLR